MVAHGEAAELAAAEPVMLDDAGSSGFRVAEEQHGNLPGVLVEGFVTRLSLRPLLLLLLGGVVRPSAVVEVLPLAEVAMAVLQTILEF